jgi:hypothetical protein
MIKYYRSKRAQEIVVHVLHLEMRKLKTNKGSNTKIIQLMNGNSIFCRKKGLRKKS